MASNTMKGTQSFQDTIKAYLETMAENDALFAVKYANPSKSVSDCCTFIINQVQKSGCNGFADDEIFGMAVHYWEESEIEVGKPINRLRDEEMAKMRRPTQSKKVSEKKPQVEQPSLFDF